MMFDRWLTGIHKKYENEKLNHFEHNLEVWRELWRVTERATHVRTRLRSGWYLDVFALTRCFAALCL